MKKMKLVVGISLFIFWAAVTAVLIAGLLFYQKNPANNSVSAPLSPGGSGKIVLDSEEISKHNSQSDCWMIIGGKIYNFTSYLGAHPGGTSAILPYCGKDGAGGFLGLPHSSYAAGLLANYYIGNLNQIADTRQIQQNIQNTSQITPPPSSARDRGEEEGD